MKRKQHIFVALCVAAAAVSLCQRAEASIVTSLASSSNEESLLVRGEVYNAALNGTETISDAVVNNGLINGPPRDGGWLDFAGHVSGAGAYTGNVLFSDVFSPGNSPATVSLQNLRFGATTTLLIELGGTDPQQFDILDISGNAWLGGRLNVAMIDSFTLGPSQTFDVIQVDGAATGQFAGLGEGSRVGNYHGVDLFISYTAGRGNDVALYTGTAGIIAAIPEPASVVVWALIAMAAGVATGRPRMGPAL